MPIYVYLCEKCSHRFETQQGFQEAPLAKCPKCRGRLRRVFQPAPIIFKGEGFYVTEHRPKDDGDGGNGKSEKIPKPVEAKKEDKK